MKMTSFAPEDFFGGGGKFVSPDTHRKTPFSSITQVQLRSVEHKKHYTYHSNTDFHLLDLLFKSCQSLFYSD